MTTQSAFCFPSLPTHSPLSPGEIIVDLFAGGGGASTGIEQALGVPVDVAVNHDADAVAMHAINHPLTRHLRSDVFEVDPQDATQGRPVGLLWASPDCKHFSKAKGGKPRSKKIRALAWVVVKWAKAVRPRVILLENVEEFLTWGPLLRDGQPCPMRKGHTFRRWKAQLEALGYAVEYRELRACDYGAPTIRKRLFLVARCDGQPIQWPKPTHGAADSAGVRSGALQPWRTAAECIDFTLPCPSIFLTREEGRANGVKRPLAEATMRRIAKGVQRFVINATRPYIVPASTPESQDRRGAPSRRANGTQCGRNTEASKTGDGVLAPIITEHANASRAASWSAAEPLRTACAEVKGGHFALVSAFLEQANAGHYTGDGRPADAPVSTITSTGAQQRLVVSHLSKPRGDNIGVAAAEPLHTVSAQGMHHAEVRAFLVKFYGDGGQWQACDDPMHTIPTRDRMGLVTVDGTAYQIADIGLRMLTPRELFRAQGFPESYVIDRGADGRRLPKDAQVRMCGNSVCPPIAAALVRANLSAQHIEQEARAA